MTVAPYRIVPLTDFRRDCAKEVDWVRHMGGRVWLTRHGKIVAAVVPNFQCEMLERFERHSLAEERARIERNYARFKAAKAGQDPDEVAPFDWGRYGWKGF